MPHPMQRKADAPTDFQCLRTKPPLVKRESGSFIEPCSSCLPKNTSMHLAPLPTRSLPPLIARSIHLSLPTSLPQPSLRPLPPQSLSLRPLVPLLPRSLIRALPPSRPLWLASNTSVPARPLPGRELACACLDPLRIGNPVGRRRALGERSVRGVVRNGSAHATHLEAWSG
jgi:hypothetical protein